MARPGLPPADGKQNADSGEKRKAERTRDELLERVTLLETELVWRQLWIHRHANAHSSVFTRCRAPSCVNLRELLPGMGWTRIVRMRGGA